MPGNLNMLGVDDLIRECARTPFSTYGLIPEGIDPSPQLQIHLDDVSVLMGLLPTFILTPRNSTCMPNYVALKLIRLI
jgi:hypothetical protein